MEYVYRQALEIPMAKKRLILRFLMKSAQKWYELSQGILDIVVKLFVLAQFRAIDSGLERITVKDFMKKTYEEDLKPIHSMIKALQSGNPNKIAEYSDLFINDIDSKNFGISGENYTKNLKRLMMRLSIKVMSQVFDYIDY